MTFEEFKKSYNANRPEEPYSEVFQPEMLVAIIQYAENRLKDAYEAGYKAAIEELNTIKERLADYDSKQSTTSQT